MTRYAVTVCRPGTLPEAEPFVTDDWQEAMQALRFELETTADLDAREHLANGDIDAALDATEAVQDGETVTVHLFGYAHELSIVVIEPDDDSGHAAAEPPAWDGPDELCVCGHLPESHQVNECIGCEDADPDDEVECFGFQPSGVSAAPYREEG